nr:hypothetical protein CFP56_53615 [Quercus suber]
MLVELLAEIDNISVELPKLRHCASADGSQPATRQRQRLPVRVRPGASPSARRVWRQWKEEALNLTSNISRPPLSWLRPLTIHNRPVSHILAAPSSLRCTRPPRYVPADQWGASGCPRRSALDVRRHSDHGWLSYSTNRAATASSHRRCRCD